MSLSGLADELGDINSRHDEVMETVALFKEICPQVSMGARSLLVDEWQRLYNIRNASSKVAVRMVLNGTTGVKANLRNILERCKLEHLREPKT